MDRLSGLAACTVVSKNHLAYARVVHRSFTRHHPGTRFFVLLADRVEGDFSPQQEPFELIELEQLPIRDIQRFCFQYDILELNCAAKPYLMRHVLQQPGISKLLYLDSDTFVYRELTEVLESLEEHFIVLTPHLVGDAEEDGRKPGERHIMESGVYNAGFLGLRNDASTGRFLGWWSDRVYDKCIRDTRQGLFVDQRWLDLVPGLFEGVHVLRNPAYNVGHWGLTHRHVEAREDGVRVNGVPLAFFHFSGLDIANPEIISAHQDRFTLSDVPSLKPLFEEYVQRVKAAGYADCQRWPYAYARFNNGAPVPGEARRLYWSLGDGARRFGNPFDSRGKGSFWSWMREEAHPGTGISRFWYHVHGARPDLQRAFPDPLGRDRAAYLSWVIGAGAQGSAIPEALVPAGPPLVVEPPFGRPRGAGRGDVPGVNVVGHARSEKGIGEAVRAMVRGLGAAAVPHCVVDEWDPDSTNRDRTVVGLLRENPYPVNLIHVNAADLPWFVQTKGPRFFRGKYNIGYWLWELPELPEVLHGSFSYLDEVWVSSSYCLEAVARSSPVPVVKVPLPLPAEWPTRGVGRGHFGLQDDQFVFLFIFDALSIVERKNPLALIEAFKRAFPGEPGVRLVLKMSHGTRGLRQSLLDAARDERVLTIDRVFDREEINSLLSVSDCYVSLHRSEGFGLTLAEAMALGKPVIATAYSANLDFMNVGNSLLVRYRLARLEKDYPPYPRDGVWAEPDVEHAAEHMRAVYGDPDHARQLGERAREDVRAYLSPEAVGALIRKRLAMVGRDLEAPGSIFRE